MRTDPREACANEDEKFGWAWFHDAIAHPLMAWSLYSRWAVRLHDWSSLKAWPRQPWPTAKGEIINVWMPRFGMAQIGFVSAGVWAVTHPSSLHTFITNASGPQDAVGKAEVWFQELANEFEGVFSNITKE